jgi:hypothetical protein
MSFLKKEEERVIGALIEKKITTPEYYPLTLNSLKNACNQKSNREPVVTYSEVEIQSILDSLFEKKMVFKVTGTDYRVPKFNENFTMLFDLSKQEIAVMCVLMLRGPQTLGEIRGRTGRLFEFDNLSAVENTLSGLMQKESEYKFVVRLPRQPGRDARYASVLTGDPDPELFKPHEEVQQDKITMLEEEVNNLKEELSLLKLEFEKFRKQFE